MVAFDTLGGDSPTALTCGFCAGEKFGVVFRDLPAPARGLDASDFPLDLRNVRVAVGSARVVAGSCQSSTETGTALANLGIYAGVTPPTGDITGLPQDGVWPEETVVLEVDEIPLTRSAADSEGGAMYAVNFNQLDLVDDGEPLLHVDPPNTYLRITVELLEEVGDRSSTCADASLPSPGMFPLRDADGRIAPERSLLYAGGLGWVWNEDTRVRVNGDWGIRIEVQSAPPGPDAGVDAGDPMDAGPGDAGPMDSGIDGGGASDGGDGADAGAPTDEGGCSCRTPGSSNHGWPAVVLPVLLALSLRRTRGWGTRSRRRGVDRSPTAG